MGGCPDRCSLSQFPRGSGVCWSLIDGRLGGNASTVTRLLRLHADWVLWAHLVRLFPFIMFLVNSDVSGLDEETFRQKSRRLSFGWGERTGCCAGCYESWAWRVKFGAIAYTFASIGFGFEGHS